MSMRKNVNNDVSKEGGGGEIFRPLGRTFLRHKKRVLSIQLLPLIFIISWYVDLIHFNFNVTYLVLLVLKNPLGVLVKFALYCT